MWEVENNPDILCMDKDDSAEEFLCEAYGIERATSDPSPATIEEKTDDVAAITEINVTEIVEEKIDDNKETVAEGFEFSDNDSEDMAPLYSKLIIIVGGQDAHEDNVTVTDKPDSSVTNHEAVALIHVDESDHIKACWVRVERLSQEDIDKATIEVTITPEIVASPTLEIVSTPEIVASPPLEIVSSPCVVDTLIITIDSDDNQSSVMSPKLELVPFSLVSKPLEVVPKSHQMTAPKASLSTKPLFEKILENLRNEKIASASKRNRNKHKVKIDKNVNGVVPILDNLFNKRFTVLGSGMKIGKKVANMSPIIVEGESTVIDVIDLVDGPHESKVPSRDVNGVIKKDNQGKTTCKASEIDIGRKGQGKFDKNLSLLNEDKEAKKLCKAQEKDAFLKEQLNFYRNESTRHKENRTEEDEEAAKWDKAREKEAPPKEQLNVDNASDMDLGRKNKNVSTRQRDTFFNDDKEANKWCNTREKDAFPKEQLNVDRNISTCHKGNRTEEDEEAEKWDKARDRVALPNERVKGDKTGSSQSIRNTIEVDVIEIEDDDDVEVVETTTERRRETYTCKMGFMTESTVCEVVTSKKPYPQRAMEIGDDFVEDVEEGVCEYEPMKLVEKKNGGRAKWFEIDKYNRRRSPPRYCELVENKVIKPPSENDSVMNDKFYHLWADSKQYAVQCNDHRRKRHYEEYEEYRPRNNRGMRRERIMGRGGRGRGYLDTDRPAVSQVDKSFDVWRKHMEKKGKGRGQQVLNNFLLEEPMPPTRLMHRYPATHARHRPHSYGQYQPGIESPEYGDPDPYFDRYPTPAQYHPGPPYPPFHMSPDHPLMDSDYSHGIISANNPIMTYRNGGAYLNHEPQCYGDVNYSFESSPPYPGRRHFVVETDTPASPDPPSDYGNDFTALDSPENPSTVADDHFSYSAPSCNDPDSSIVAS